MTAFDRNTVGTPMAVGESGYLTTIVTIVVVVWIVRLRTAPLTSAAVRSARL
jgi:hypothetical protein